MAVEGADPTAEAVTHLRAEFTIEPHPKANCSIVASGPRGEAVTNDLICRDGSCDEGCECRSSVSDPDTGDRRYVLGEVTERCICSVFRRHDCATSIERFDAGVLDVTITIPSNADLAEIVSALRATGATVQLRRISTAHDGARESPLEIHVDGLTDKQREAVRVAVEAGYYETPRETDLDELADRLEISKSAVSQRLTAVQSNLVTTLFDQQSL